MLASNAYLDPFHRLADDAVAFVESELELPVSVTLEALDSLLAHRTIKLEDLIAFVTGLPRNRDEEADGNVDQATAFENALKRCRAAFWLFTKAGDHSAPVARGSRSFKSIEREGTQPIDPDDFLIPSCLGAMENSIATDMERANVDYLKAWFDEARLDPEILKMPSARWYEVAFDTKWLDATLRPLIANAGQMAEAPRAQIQAEFSARRATWPADKTYPNVPDDIAWLQEKIGKHVPRSVYLEFRTPALKRKPGRPPKLAGD